MAKRGKDFKMPDPLFSFAFMNHLGAEIKDEYKSYTFDKSNPRMATGQSFPDYSTKGAGVGFRTIGKGSKRRVVFIDSYKNRKASGKITINSQRRTIEGGYERSKAPVATGGLKTDTQHKAGKDFIDLGWSSHAYKVKHLRKMGRILTEKSNPISDDVLKKIMPLFNKHLAKVMPKGTHTITIGKKK